MQTWLVENPLEAREFCPVFGKDLISSLHLISFIFSIFAQGMIPILPIIVNVIIRISWNIICNIANILQFIISFVCLHIFEAPLAHYSESAVSGFLRW